MNQPVSIDLQAENSAQHNLPIAEIRRWVQIGYYLSKVRRFRTSSRAADEVEEWVKHGFTADEVWEWLPDGFKPYEAAAFRAAGLTYLEATCAWAQLGKMPRPNYTPPEFFRLAAKYKNCCPERTTPRSE